MEEIIIVLLSVLIVISLIILVLVFVFKNKQPKTSESELRQIGGIEKQIELLPDQFKKDIELSVSSQMNKVIEQSGSISEKNNEKLERFQNSITESLNKRFDSLNKQMDDKLTAINKKVDEKLSEGFKGTSETMAQVRERLQAIDDAQKNLEGLSKEVVSLKNVLEGNQTRGAYGEYQLSMVLHNVFGDTTGCYEEQYTLKKHKTDTDKDVRADAVVFMPEPNKMICIDSKFPFQDYQRMLEAEDSQEKETYKKDFSSAVKKHITAIKEKYIIENKTAPEALMFIPNDGVFAFIHHELLDVVDYAREKRVILTSPSTLPAILVTINMVRIEVERAKNAKEITKNLAKLSKDFEMFGREWDVFSRQLETATKSKEKFDQRVNKLTTKFDTINSSTPLIEEQNELIDINEEN